MQWSDEGIILGARKFGENKAIITIFTKNNGKQQGLFRTNKSNKAYIQPGTKAKVTWYARLSEQLGTWTIEPIAINCSSIMSNQAKLCSLTSICHVLSHCLAEAEDHSELFQEFELYIKKIISRNEWITQHIRFEIAILRELGYGLDFSCCAATGQTDDLIYVSPRTGRAVSKTAGAPYIDRLLHLPQFLINIKSAESDIVSGLNLTKYFIEKHLLSHASQALPSERLRLERFFAAPASLANTDFAGI